MTNEQLEAVRARIGNTGEPGHCWGVTPSEVFEILDHIDEQAREIERLNEMSTALTGNTMHMDNVIQRLRAENERLKEENDIRNWIANLDLKILSNDSGNRCDEDTLDALLAQAPGGVSVEDMHANRNQLTAENAALRKALEPITLAVLTGHGQVQAKFGSWIWFTEAELDAAKEAGE